MNLEEKQSGLQKEALGILSSISEMEKNGASKSEIEAKIEEANKIIAESGKLTPKEPLNKSQSLR